jgi:putative inorganic carbon (hco3(-)) transporter
MAVFMRVSLIFATTASVFGSAFIVQPERALERTPHNADVPAAPPQRKLMAVREGSGSADLLARPVSAAPLPLWRTVMGSALAIAAGVGAALLAGLVGWGPYPLLGVIALVLAASLAFLVWRADPAWMLTAALVLSPLASNWPRLGIPGALSPNRLLLIAGIGAVLLRAPGTSGRPRRLIVTHVHWVLVATILYAVVSAAVTGTLFEKAAFFRLFDVFGVLPFLVFLVTPSAFRGARNRAVLLAGLVGLGAYLGLIALLETAGPRALVYPRFILSARNATDHRAMGIFLDPVMNGTGMFVCGVAAAIALATWRRASARLLAGATILLCAAGVLFTLERSVWVGAILGVAIGAIAVPRLRRLMLTLALAGAIVVGGSLLVVPGLSDHVRQRANDRATIWDRQNLTTAASNVIAPRPVLGFGWSTFERSSLDYFRQSPNYPLDPNLGFSATTQGSFSIHNELLDYGVTLGLLGTALWLAGIAIGVIGALRVRGSPSLEPWRLALLPVVAFYVVVSSFVPPLLFPNLMLWVWIGVVWSGYYRRTDPTRAGPPATMN